VQPTVQPAVQPAVWRGPALLLGGGLVVSEAVAQLLHLEGTTLLTGGLLAGGWWLLSRRTTRPSARRPRSLDGWVERCVAVLAQFERLLDEAEREGSLAPRREELQALQREPLSRPLQLALASSQPPPAELQPPFAAALQGPRGLRLHWGEGLPALSPDWRWSPPFARSDLLLFHLRRPLRGADLRWLEALPADQPVWLLLEDPLGGGEGAGLAGELRSLWPAADPQRLLAWDGSATGLTASLAPLADWLAREGGRLTEATALRRFEALHGRWQGDLEGLRRSEWQGLLRRTQWLVAAGVIAAPLPSVDLLVLACANGLMLREMARLWECPWDAETLRAAALELGRAALALGLVEWSGQALSAALRLHHAGWLIGGGLQALSAAYLTRVVGRAMADVLALSAGVPEADLAAIRRQAPMLVARAAEAEKLDWAGFLQQGSDWLGQQRSATPKVQQST
jgi:hypothetical protein